MQKMMVLQMAEATARLVSRHLIAPYATVLTALPGPLQSLLDDGWQIAAITDPPANGGRENPNLLELWFVIICDKPDTPTAL
jgi:hypothetical protein